MCSGAEEEEEEEAGSSMGVYRYLHTLTDTRRAQVNNALRHADHLLQEECSYSSALLIAKPAA